MSTPVIIVHGGSGWVADELHEPAVAGVRLAAETGRAVLLRGGSSEEAVVAAVRIMEDDETFNAGRGSCMTEDGGFEMDAGIMRSRDGAIGAVAAVPDVRDAILLAQLVMDHDKHNVLVGDPVVRLANARGVGSFGRDEVWTRKAQARFDGATRGDMVADGRADTVGAVALDRSGNLCAGGSTGGVLLKSRGRVGDTPLVGSGFFADAGLGAAVATGMGEAIMRHVVSLRTLEAMARGEDPDAAARSLCERVAAEGATCGILALSPDGRTAVAHASAHMSWAIARGDDPLQSGLRRG